MDNDYTDHGVKLKLIKGGKLSVAEFQKQTLVEKHSFLKFLQPQERMALILADPDRQSLVRGMQPQELYWLIKEIGIADAAGLMCLAAPDQLVFIMDIELWQGWSFAANKGVEFFGYLLEGGDEQLQELLPHLDFKLLTLFLGKELLVGGGIGDLTAEEEQLTHWDHTFDDVFMFNFRNPAHAGVVGTFLERLCRIDYPLYIALMENVRSDIDVEQEEECFHFRSGRLQDLGFPPLDEARALYSRVNPGTFTVANDKKLLPGGDDVVLPELTFAQATLLQRVMPLVETPELRMELNYLINSALVAEDAPFADIEAMNVVLQRVCGYLNIALEYLCGDDEQKGAETLSGEYLKRLFQLGFSILLKLKDMAEKLAGEGYETGKVLTGLKSSRPQFYRGLDPDGADGYREFRDMADVRKMTDFLAKL